MWECRVRTKISRGSRGERTGKGAEVTGELRTDHCWERREQGVLGLW